MNASYVAVSQIDAFIVDNGPKRIPRWNFLVFWLICKADLDRVDVDAAIYHGCLRNRLPSTSTSSWTVAESLGFGES